MDGNTFSLERQKAAWQLMIDQAHATLTDEDYAAFLGYMRSVCGNELAAAEWLKNKPEPRSTTDGCD